MVELSQEGKTEDRACSFLSHSGKVHTLHVCYGSYFLTIVQNEGVQPSGVFLKYKNGAFVSAVWIMSINWAVTNELEM